MLQTKNDITTEQPAEKEIYRQSAVALVEHYGEGKATAVAADIWQMPQQWIREVTLALPFHQSMPVFEHIYGVVPLLGEYFEASSSGNLIADIIEGTVPTSLGLFTPSPAFSLQASAIKSTVGKNGLLLSGTVRVATGNSTHSLVLAGLGNREMRLALVENRWEKAKRSDTSRPYWLTLEEVAVDEALISKPVDITVLQAPGHFACCLNRYAGVYALAANVYIERDIRALRKAARESNHNGVSMNTSQLVAMGITELEIQSHLLNTAVQGDLDIKPCGVTLAAAAARLLAEVVTKTAELAGKAGLPVAGPLSCTPEAGLGVTDAVFGGQWMAESLLAESMGL